MTWRRYEGGGALTLRVSRYTHSPTPFLVIVVVFRYPPGPCRSSFIVQGACVGLRGGVWL